MIASRVCCLDSVNHMLYLGNECSDLSILDVQNCVSYPEYRLYPCPDLGIEKHSKFCKIANVDCIVQITFSTACDGSEHLNLCNMDKYDCRKLLIK